MGHLAREAGDGQGARAILVCKGLMPVCREALSSYWIMQESGLVPKVAFEDTCPFLLRVLCCLVDLVTSTANPGARRNLQKHAFDSFVLMREIALVILLEPRNG